MKAITAHTLYACTFSKHSEVDFLRSFFLRWRPIMHIFADAARLTVSREDSSHTYEGGFLQIKIRRVLFAPVFVGILMNLPDFEGIPTEQLLYPSAIQPYVPLLFINNTYIFRTNLLTEFLNSLYVSLVLLHCMKYLLPNNRRHIKIIVVQMRIKI